MLDVLDRLYTIVSRWNFVFFRKGMRFVIRVLANILIPLVYKFNTSRYCLTPTDLNTGRVIVSLTSFPARITKLHLVCESLLRQTYKPDRIIIWLSKLQFKSLDSLPSALLKLRDRGVFIRLVDDDIRSHKKYYYALQEFPEDNIVLVDDDILYRSGMIEDLMKYHEKYSDAIIAQYGRKIIKNSRGIESYAKWKLIKNSVENLRTEDIFFGSGGGTLINSHLFYSDITNKELFLKLTPYADDVWLNYMAKLKGTLIVKTKYYSANLEIMYKHNKTLSSVNNASLDNKNDMQIHNVLDYYGAKLAKNESITYY